MDRIPVLELFFSVSKTLALIAVCAYLTAQWPLFRRTLNQHQTNRKDKLFLMSVFGMFSALGNYLGIPVLGSLANHRIVGAVVGGLFGGPWVGLGAGVIGAISRFFIGGFTMPVAVVSNIIVGFLSGFLYSHYGPKNINLKIAAMTALGAEFFLKATIILFSQPFDAAWGLEKVIALPTLVLNVLGVGLFVYVIRDVYGEQEKAQAQTAHQAMNVLRKTHGLLYGGLSGQIAQQVAQIVYDNTFAAAVALTDRERVLAFVGYGVEHHQTAQPIVSDVTYRAIHTGKTIIENNQACLGWPYPACALSSVIVTPLIVDNLVVGTLKLFKAHQEVISLAEAELIEGMADVLSLELSQAKLNEQNRLLGQAQFNVLKAQVHPHFLFNILGTIRALTRTNVDKSRAVIQDLAGFLRRTLNREREFVTLAEELMTVHMYVRLEQARYGERIQLEEFLSPEFMAQLVPVFSVQPLVENAIRHGLSCKKGGGTIRIEAHVQDGAMNLWITDDGMGIPPEKMGSLLQQDVVNVTQGSTGIGLKNVHFRLQHLYGTEYGLEVHCNEPQGTKIIMRLPHEGNIQSTEYVR